MPEVDELGTPPLDGTDDTPELAPGELECEVCGIHFAHSGRGRKPKRCPEHRKSRATSSTRASASEPAEKSPRRPRGIDQLQGTIHQQLVMVGTAVAFFDTFDAKVILTKADRGAKALANLAQTNSSIRKALERSVEMAGWGPVLLWGAEMALPILAHHGFIRGVPDPAEQDDGSAV